MELRSVESLKSIGETIDECRRSCVRLGLRDMERSLAQAGEDLERVIGSMDEVSSWLQSAVMVWENRDKSRETELKRIADSIHKLVVGLKYKGVIR